MSISFPNPGSSDFTSPGTSSFPRSVSLWAYWSSAPVDGVLVSFWQLGFSTDVELYTSGNDVRLYSAFDDTLLVTGLLATSTWFWFGLSIGSATFPTTGSLYYSTGTGAISSVAISQNMGALALPSEVSFGAVEFSEETNALIAAPKAWTADLSAEQLAAERCLWTARRTTDLYGSPNAIGTTNAGVDWSGNGHDFSAAALGSSRISPPIAFVG